MNDTAQIILVIFFCCFVLAVTFAIIVLAIDTIKEWKNEHTDPKERLDTCPLDPMKHGEWISVPHKKNRICSVCGCDEPYKFADENANVFDYCPHCGAKM